MTKVSVLATRSLRFLGVVVGGDTPETEDQSIAETELLDLLKLLPEYGAGREYRELETSVGVTVESDVRLIATVSGIVITTPENPKDGSRFMIIPVAGAVSVVPEGRKIQGSSSTITVTSPSQWVYRADLGDWLLVTGLTNASDSPYPDWVDGPLVKLNAGEIAPIFAMSLTSDQYRKIEDARMLLAAHYSRPRETKPSEQIPVALMGGNTARRYR